jgi:S1-C subfamily serine protease
MMISEQNIGEWAERYLRHELSGAEHQQLKQILDANPDLNRSWQETLELFQMLKLHADQQKMRSKIKTVSRQMQDSVPQQMGKISPLFPFRGRWRMAGIAAALILVSSLSTIWFVNNKNQKTGAQYMLLRREIETIKHSQSKIMDSLKQGVRKDAAEARYGGTGFALTNDGFVATNYHVVKDAHSIFIQTVDNSYKAYLVAFEPASDVAILKIEDKSFRFGKNSLPYSLSTHISGLGQKVFTIGFPQDDLVYNEGYISCESGYGGDAASYQLEMTANPGQSGAPVIDKYGNIVALVTGKQSNTSGTTFAVHADALLQLIRTLPKDTNLHLTTTNRLRGLERTEQVSRLRDYICAVKVN